MPSPLEDVSLSIKKLQHRHHRALDAALAPLGVSLVQWHALREIDRNPGVSQHRLAEFTFNSDQAFGTLVVRLLRLDLIERRPGSGRAARHRLMPRGDELLRQGQERLSDVIAAAFASLDDNERQTLAALLGKLLDNNRPLR